MATFNLADYQEQQQKRAANNSGNGGERKPVHFMNEFLGKDGDQVVVRFPYTGLQDLLFESVHKVVGVFPGDKFGKSVRCTGDDTCPLCNSADEAQRKKKTMFYAKMVVYNPTPSGADLCATVWERPAMFAESELKQLMLEYGDLTEQLFKITRTGKGTDTRYNIMPVNMKSPVYSTPAYKKDLSCLEGIDATKILSKSIEQYNEALNPSAKTEKSLTPEEVKTFNAQEPVMEEVKVAQTSAQVADKYAGYVNPQYGQPVDTAGSNVVTEPVNQPAQQPVQQTVVENTTPQTTVNSNGVTRYRF